MPEMDAASPLVKHDFDIVSAYHHILTTDPDLTMPIAAIEALIQALANTPSTTVSETLNLLSNLTTTLKAGVPNSISLSAGTDLFQRYIITSLRPSQIPRQSNSPSESADDFDQVRTHLISNGRLFVQRAKEARDTIAQLGKQFIRDGHTVLTNGGSRVVGALLRAAASDSPSHPRANFNVIYVVDQSNHDDESRANISALRNLGIPVATISPTAVAYSMSHVTTCFVGAEGVVENGGIISRMGTYQIGVLAKSASKPFYVVAESHKFVRLYPLNQMDLPIEQNILDFSTQQVDQDAKVKGPSERQLAVDYTASYRGI